MDTGGTGAHDGSMVPVRRIGYPEGCAEATRHNSIIDSVHFMGPDSGSESAPFRCAAHRVGKNWSRSHEISSPPSPASVGGRSHGFLALASAFHIPRTRRRYQDGALQDGLSRSGDISPNIIVRTLVKEARQVGSAVEAVPAQCRLNPARFSVRTRPGASPARVPPARSPGRNSLCRWLPRAWGTCCWR